MKLTMRAIIRWEQANQRPFSSMNYTDEDDIVSLFYVCTLSENPDLTLSEFKKNLSDESIEKMIKEFERQTFIDSQFQDLRKKQSPKIEETEEAEETKESAPVYIKDVVPMLIMNGLDVHFALNEMQLSDVSLFTNAYDQKNRREQESFRLWVYHLIRPHLSKNSGLKSPKDLQLFSWEAEEYAQKVKEETEEGMPVYKAFMNSAKK